MTGNTFGKIFKITTCGESYSGGFRKFPGIPEELRGGLLVIADGVPPGIKVDAALVQAELDKRRPGLSALATPRKEADKVFIFSGVMEDDLTTGAPVGMVDNSPYTLPQFLNGIDHFFVASNVAR